MTLRRALMRFARDESGGPAAEYALLVPVVLLIMFTIIDVGAYAWTINQGEKATHMGARLAVVTASVDSGMEGYDFVGQTVGGVTYGQGDIIQASALGLVTCTSANCTCTTAPCPWTVARDATAFNLIRDRMRMIYPAISDANIVIEYRGSGLGYAGDPNGSDIAPLVTIKLQNMTYSPMALSVFRSAVKLPSFSYSLTLEDASGSTSF